jgi:hypothetical protein
VADAAPAGPIEDARARDFSEKHMVFDDDLDAGPIPIDHTDMRWGDYIDRHGRPAVGWHSHDRDAGNAR